MICKLQNWFLILSIRNPQPSHIQNKLFLMRIHHLSYNISTFVKKLTVVIIQCKYSEIALGKILSVLVDDLYFFHDAKLLVNDRYVINAELNSSRNNHRLGDIMI